MLVLNLPAFENKKYTADEHFQGNGLYGEILTKKEPIRTNLPCHMIILPYIYLFLFRNLDINHQIGSKKLPVRQVLKARLL